MSAPGTPRTWIPVRRSEGSWPVCGFRSHETTRCRRRWRRPTGATVAVGAAGEAVTAADGDGVDGAAVDGDALGVVGPQAAMDSPRIDEDRRWADGGSRGSRRPPGTGKGPVVRGDQVGPQRVEGRPPPLRCPLPCDAHPFGLVTRARRARRRQERRIGLDQEPFGRHDRRPHRPTPPRRAGRRGPRS